LRIALPVAAQPLLASSILNCVTPPKAEDVTPPDSVEMMEFEPVISEHDAVTSKGTHISNAISPGNTLLLRFAKKSSTLI
jgi:hypothetical protein